MIDNQAMGQTLATLIDETLALMDVFASPRGYLGDCPLCPAPGGPLSQDEMWARQEALVRRFDALLHPLVRRP